MENLKTTCEELKGTGKAEVIIAKLTAGLKTTVAAKVCGTNVKAVQRARKSEKENGEFIEKYSKRLVHKRDKISEAERKAVEEWIKEECPMRSGTKYHTQFCTSEQLYDRYKLAMEQFRIRWGGPLPGAILVARSRTTFDMMKQAIRIRVAKRYYGQFNCTKCARVIETKRRHHELLRERRQMQAEGKDSSEDSKFTGELAATIKTLEEIQGHQELREHQHMYLMHCRHEAIQSNRRRILVVMDFSKYTLDQNITQSTAEKGDQPDWLHDMVQVFEYWDDGDDDDDDGNQGTPTEGKEEKKEAKNVIVNESKEEKKTEKKRKPRKSSVEKPPEKPRRTVTYVDNLCRDPGIEGNDTLYVKQAMRNAISKGYFDGFTRVDLFSDGGPKHYKSVYGMHTMSGWADWWRELKPGHDIPDLLWNFTAAYHGHGVADSHAGIFSQMLTRAKNSGQHGKGQEGIGGGPKNVDEVAEMMRTMKGTQAMVFDKIERPEYRNDLQPLDSIRKHFQFRFRYIAVVDEEKTAAAQKKADEEGKEEKTEKKQVEKIMKWEPLVQYRRQSSDEEEVEGDPWVQEQFVFTGKKSKSTKKPKRERKILDDDDDEVDSNTNLSLSSSTSSSAAINGVRKRAKKQQKVAKEKGEAEKEEKKEEVVVPSSSSQQTKKKNDETSKPKSKSTMKKRKPIDEIKKEEAAKWVKRGKPKSKSRGKKMVEMAEEEATATKTNTKTTAKGKGKK